MRLSLLVCALSFMAMAAMAAAPAESAEEAKPQGPTAIRLGGIELIPLHGSSGQGKVELLVGAGKDDLDRANAPGGMDNSINAFLVKMNGKNYLFDTGNPDDSIVTALAAAGVKPEAIDAVFITHFHGDHIGGLVKNGKAVYPKADLHIPIMEVDRYTGANNAFLLIYSARSNAFRWGRELVPGVTGYDAAGHTPGHTVYRLESEGGSLLILADLIHFGGVQLPNPKVAVTYDTDPVKAVAARERIFSEAAEEDITVASMHLRYPGVGVLKKQGNGYILDK